MTPPGHIERAAVLIATLDPHLADLWRKCPHRRTAVVAVLRHALLDCPSHHHRADDIAFALTLALEITELEQTL